MRFHPWVGLTVATPVWTAHAHADPASAQAGPLPSQPQDVVRLKNGGVLRGTIVELAPGDSVTILLATGETRKVLLTETTYAGPQSAAQASSARATGDGGGRTDVRPYATIQTRGAQLKLLGSEKDVTFHLQTAEAHAPGIQAQGFSRLCTAPCGVEVPEGVHRFGLSRPSGDVAAGGDDVSVHDGDTVRGTYDSRQGLRTFGIALIPISIGAGVGMFALAFSSSLESCTTTPADMFSPANTTCTPNTAFLLLAPVVAIGGGITGFVIAHAKDGATFEVIPASGAASLPGALPGARRATEGREPVPGAAVRWRF